ncbi:MAG: hypothetical protein IPO48_09390 [Saprospiraceae bacterium]|nr:hypothetical protein [Saprospiraceae bacterium]
MVDVEDIKKTPPVTICDEACYSRSYYRSGTAWVPASVFDGSSYDECKLESFWLEE